MSKYKIVTKPEDINTKEWGEFVKNHPNGNIFQTPEMFEVYKRTNKYKPILVAVFNENSQIVGIILALRIKENKGLPGVFSSRSVIYGGPLFEIGNLEVLNLILKNYNCIAKKMAIYSQYRNEREWSEKEKKVFNENGYKFEDHLNILVDLKKEQDKLWIDIKKSRKEGIRKANRNGLQFYFSYSSKVTPIFYKLLKKTYNNARLPYPDMDFFDNLIKTIPSDNIKYFSLKKEDDTLIALIAFIYKSRLSAYYIGIDRDEKFFKMRPVDLFYWEVIKWGNENNCKIYDWMGAGKPNVPYGVRDFKLQFGGDLVNYGRFELVHKPLLMKIATNGMKLYQKVLNT